MKDGIQRERQLKRLLEADGWTCLRAAGSLGPVDLVAMKACYRPRLIEIKANEGSPYKTFSPQDRDEMRRLAIEAGADAWLVHWPSRRQPEWIPSSGWPEQRARAA